MKKKLILLALAAVLLLNLGSAFAEAEPAEDKGMDFSSMPTEELAAVIGAARTELAKRAETNENSKLLYDKDGVIVQLTGDPLFELREQNGDYLELGFTLINDTDYLCAIKAREMYLNSWKIVTYKVAGGTLDPHTKSRNCQFKFGGLKNLADIDSLDQIEIGRLSINVEKYSPDGTITEDGGYQAGKFVEGDVVDITLVYSEANGFQVVTD